MKLKAEIKDDKFTYEFDIGTSRGAGETKLNAENMMCFCAVIQKMCEIFNYSEDERIRQRMRKMMKAEEASE